MERDADSESIFGISNNEFRHFGKNRKKNVDSLQGAELSMDKMLVSCK